MYFQCSPFSTLHFSCQKTRTNLCNLHTLFLLFYYPSSTGQLNTNSTTGKKKEQKPRMGSGENVFTVVAKNIDVLAMPLVSLVFPLYCSIKAIETKSRTDDEQWLTYWVLYSLITLFELTFSKILEWFPIWSYAKLIGVCWLVLPYFNGAAYVYEHFIRPFYKNPQVKLWYVPRKKDTFSKPDDVLTAAEKYIEENGPEAFERLIARADRESRTRRSSYTIFHDDYEY